MFADEFGPYGSPTSDLERAMITYDNQNVLTALIAFSNETNLDKHLSTATEILEKLIGATNISKFILKIK